MDSKDMVLGFLGGSHMYNTKDAATTRLEEMKQSGGVLSFCTDIFSDRGRAYRCKVTEEGHAVVLSTKSWWGREYRESNERIGEDLGQVVVYWNGGNTFVLKVGKLEEGIG